MVIPTLEILTKARALISEPKKWTKGCYARDKDGNARGPNEESAVCWCAAGAIKRAAGKHDDQERWLKVKWARRALFEQIDESDETYGLDLTGWNDSALRTHEDVLQAFDAAIEERNPSNFE